MKLLEQIDQSSLEILIVEDSPTQAAQLKHTLMKNKYSVRIAKDGFEALKEIQQKEPSMVISDVLMPSMDGYQLCTKIKFDERLKHIPVILLTQLSGPKDIIKGLECRADHFITKPYDEKYLMSHVQHIVINGELRKNTIADLGIEIFFAGQKHFITSDRIQILDLLFSTYEAVVRNNQELEKKNQELEKSLETIKTLSGLIPICAQCKKIRNDEGYWQKLEEFIHEHSDAEFTHGLCPECEKHMYASYIDGKQGADEKNAAVAADAGK